MRAWDRLGEGKFSPSAYRASEPRRIPNPTGFCFGYSHPIATTVARLYLFDMLQRTFPAGFIAPCLPTKTDKLPSGREWLHEIKHDGFQVIAVEGVQEDAFIVAAVAHTIERSDAVVITGNRLPVDDAGARAQASQGLDDEREAIREIIARPL